MKRYESRFKIWNKSEGDRMKFLNIGFGNLVSVDRIISIASPDSAPIKRLVQDAKEENRVIDAS